MSTSTPSPAPADGSTGDALFLAEDYAGAAAAYEAALAAAGPGDDRASLEHRLHRARIAVRTGMDRHEAQALVYERLFRPGHLLGGPRPGEASQPPAAPRVAAGPGHAAAVVAGRLAGRVGSAVLHGLTELAGRAGTNGRVWTTWYTTGTGLPPALGRVAQVLKIAHMRETLFANNVVRTYPPSAKTGFAEPPVAPPAWALRWRTADGSWNNLDRDADGRYDPMVGAAYTRFFRNVGDDLGLRAVHPRTDPATDPVSVREISRALFAPKESGRVLAPFLNVWACVWIQFMNHDWVSHGTSTAGRTVPLPLAADDPLRRYGIDHLDVRTTPADPTRQPYESQMPATFVNEVTHWWDGSQIYGSDEDTQRSLRTLSGGRMRLGEGDVLPRDPETGLEQTGFNRNWWVALSTIHTLFVREHNAIADTLAAAHPDWDDDALFHTARLVNVAVMAKIHTVEWTPAVLPNHTLSEGMYANWYGLVTALFGGERKRVLEEIPIGNRELGGIVGNPHATFAKYGLSEEFTAVYRLHSLLPDSVVVHRHGVEGPVADVPLMETRHAAAPGLVDRFGVDSLALSLGLQQCGALVPNNYPAYLLDMSLPGEPLVDLGALDVFRDRERGVPPYNQLRLELGLRRVPSFDELSDDAEVVRTLRRLYGTTDDGRDRIDDMDLLVGTLCESHRPTGFGFGETLFQLFVLNASWRLLGDRFFTDDYREEVYTAEGLAWIDDTTMKSLLLRHFPSLADTGLANVTNAFEPWDTGRLDPARHPLRAFDRSLGPDPWAGDDPAATPTGRP